MSQAVSIWKCAIFFTIYTLASLAVYFTTANTIPAALVYLFVLTPFYITCILYLINLGLQHRQQKLRYRLLPLGLSVVFQLLIILTSPASCSGWKQGKACYSFIQAYLTEDSLNNFQDTLHWRIVEFMFAIALLLHVIFVIATFKKIRIEKP